MNNTNTKQSKPTGIVAERNELRDENAQLRETLANLEAYLRSSKFAVDPTVQVVDVLTRIGRY